FFFQAEDGIRDRNVTGVQTCALPISCGSTLFETTPPRTSWPLLSSFLNRHLKESLYFAETLLVCDFNVYYHAIFRIYICTHLIRSEERRVGKECSSQRLCYHDKK